MEGNYFCFFCILIIWCKVGNLDGYKFDRKYIMRMNKFTLCNELCRDFFLGEIYGEVIEIIVIMIYFVILFF